MSDKSFLVEVCNYNLRNACISGGKFRSSYAHWTCAA